MDGQKIIELNIAYGLTEEQTDRQTLNAKGDFDNSLLKPETNFDKHHNT